jgi:hypothetical protein
MLKAAASRWFVLYSLSLTIIALACQVGLTIRGPRPGPVDPARPYRAAVQRIIAEALPPGWTAEHGHYMSRIAGLDDTGRAYASIGLHRGGRAVPAAGPVTGAPPAEPTTWDPADATTPDRFKVWLAGIAGSVGGKPDDVRDDVERRRPRR